MRTVFVAVLTVAIAGCGETRSGQRTSSVVVAEPPKLSERFRVSRQREAERATLNDTVVTGNADRQ